MIDHVDIVVSSLDAGLDFYRGLLGPLGWTRETPITGERGERVVYLGLEGSSMAIGLREARTAGPVDRYAPGLHHLCITAPSRAEVDERVAWAAANGGTIESPPQEWPYAEGYYAGFVHDPDGIKLEIVCH